MTGMPRRDGAFVFYQILSQYEGDPANKWRQCNYPDYVDRYDFPETCGFEKGVTLQASGDVWQRCGIHGTTELDYAKTVLRLVRKQFPQHKHKIVHRLVTMTTTEVDA